MAAKAQEEKKAIPVPTVYPRDAVLTIEQVAAGLQVESIATVEKMDLPFTYIGGGRMKRIRWGVVLDILDAKAFGASLKAVA